MTARADGRPSASSQPAVPLRLESEFATVVVELDETALGPRLRVTDVRGGRHVLLDPLEVATLAWLTHEDIATFMDPSYRRWRGGRLE